MRNFLYTGLFVFLLFYGCHKEGTDYACLLTGTWINTRISGEDIPADSSFVCQYGTDGMQMYAQGYQLDENNKSWIESKNFTYVVEGKNIILDGIDGLDDDFHIEMEIKTLDEESFTYSVTRFLMNDTELPDPAVYTCQRATKDYTSALIGIWYGNGSTPGTAGLQPFYSEYKTDGSFAFYYQDDEGNWQVDADEESRYFLYGDFLVTNYTAAQVAEGNYKFYDCWNILIEEDTMIFTALREDNRIEIYEMERVESAPVL
jgi:hypothetical protein